MSRIYMSVEDGFEHSPEHLYRTSKSIAAKLHSLSDLVLVHPADYRLTKGTINAGYRWTDHGLEQVVGEHEPTGDLFIIFGDETSKNAGLAFARDQYSFLRRLEAQGNFPAFFNTPDAEERTLKDYLIGLHDQGFPIGATYPVTEISSVLERYGSAIVKPIFGCRGAAVHKVDSLEDFESLGIGNDYVLQEPLEGPEKRIVILDGDFLCSRIHHNRNTPWQDTGSQHTATYEPSAEEIQHAQGLAQTVGADILGVDFIGPGINEINGTGTGLIIYDHNGRLLYDKTDQFIEHALRLIP